MRTQSSHGGAGACAAWLERYFRPRERIDTSPPVADEVVPTTCYMCACRCGIRVHLLDGGIRYIDGNPGTRSIAA